MLGPALIASKPEDAGIDSEKLEAVFSRARRDVDEGVLPSAQVAIARNGKLAGMRTFGSAIQGGEERPATDETLYSIFSSTKAVVGVAVWLLFEDGLLKLDERVADIIPEFGTNGKEVVTVPQVLLHTGGFPYAPLRPEYWGDRKKLIEAFGRWRLNWEPGTRYEYHPTSAHWVLSEIINRRTGVDFRDFIRSRVTGPMGLDELFVGLPPEQDARVAEVRWVSEAVEPPGGWGEVTPEAVLRFNGVEARRSGLPGAGGIAGAAELAMFYQPLINGGETANGTRVIKRETIEFGTKVRTPEMLLDPVWKIPPNRSLSMVIAGDDGNSFMRGFGRTCSPLAFGHGGAGGQIAWGDPETGISVGYCTNGFTDWLTVGRRVTAISSLAGSCAI
ncbi:MAG: beta-lactamase family protein [Chloroflexi bacterium]|nr:MAG: beta-lactamase family protein [Chloroflexota bacterium]